MNMSTALVCILVGLILIGLSIFLSERSRKKFDEPVPEPEPVLADLSGVPTVSLITARKALVDALAIPFEAQTRAGLCETVGYHYITMECIKAWDENEGNNSYPVEYVKGELIGESMVKFNGDYYKMRNPKRRRLAHFMIKCIEREIDKRQDETR